MYKRSTTDRPRGQLDLFDFFFKAHFRPKSSLFSFEIRSCSKNKQQFQSIRWKGRNKKKMEVVRRKSGRSKFKSQIKIEIKVPRENLKAENRFETGMTKKEYKRIIKMYHLFLIYLGPCIPEDSKMQRRKKEKIL